MNALFSGYDHWLDSGPGGPLEDGEVECGHCDGTGEVDHDPNDHPYRCSYCDGTGRVLASDVDEESAVSP